MEPITFCAILFGASVLAGALGALLGLGGGVIVVPDSNSIIILK